MIGPRAGKIVDIDKKKKLDRIVRQQALFFSGSVASTAFGNHLKRFVYKPPLLIQKRKTLIDMNREQNIRVRGLPIVRCLGLQNTGQKAKKNRSYDARSRELPRRRVRPSNRCVASESHR